MKSLVIESVEYRLVLRSFTEWLTTLGYSKSAIVHYPISVRELLHFLEVGKVTTLDGITAELVMKFMDYLKTRKNQQNGAGLSANTINSYINAISKFMLYLRSAKGIFLEVDLKRFNSDGMVKEILTKTEIEGLLESMEYSIHPIVKRDRAIIACLYGAGLRKNELVKLDIEDVSFSKRVIHVRHGKGGKERLVPITKRYSNYIKEYVKDCRDVFMGIAKESESALFIHVDGTRINADLYYDIIDAFVFSSGIASLQEKRVTPHTFRHSIATHLMQAGMPIESIARFLGHASLDSTMVYTHIVEQLKLEE